MPATSRRSSAPSVNAEGIQSRALIPTAQVRCLAHAARARGHLKRPALGVRGAIGVRSKSRELLRQVRFAATRAQNFFTSRSAHELLESRPTIVTLIFKDGHVLLH